MLLVANLLSYDLCEHSFAESSYLRIQVCGGLIFLKPEMLSCDVFHYKSAEL